MKKEFKIDIEIYKEEVLKESLLAFKEISEIELKDENIIIEGENNEEIEEIFNELMNYVISNINEQ